MSHYYAVLILASVTGMRAIDIAHQMNMTVMKAIMQHNEKRGIDAKKPRLITGRGCIFFSKGVVEHLWKMYNSS